MTKIVDKCNGCLNQCKIEVNEELLENLIVLSCPKGKKFKKKDSTNKK